MQSPIAPWPGKMIRSAAATRSGSEVTSTSTAAPPTYRTAFSTERRFPMPKSMIATCCIGSVPSSTSETRRPSLRSHTRPLGVDSAHCNDGRCVCGGHSPPPERIEVTAPPGPAGSGTRRDLPGTPTDLEAVRGRAVQSTPLVEGMAAGWRSSRAAAMRTARPNALNIVSATWCALRPSRLSMWSVARAELTNP